MLEIYKNIREIEHTIETLQRYNRGNLVTVGGCFDLLHIGHVNTIRKARCMGHFLIVLLNSDKSVARLKGSDNRPIMNEDERAELLIAIKDVDIVVIFDEDTPEHVLSIIKPNFHVKGEEYTNSDIAERKVVEDNGGEIVFVEMDKDISTTSIIDRIRS